VLSGTAIGTFSVLIVVIAGLGGAPALHDMQIVATTDAVVGDDGEQALVVQRVAVQNAPGGCRWRLGMLELSQPDRSLEIVPQQSPITTLVNTSQGVIAGGPDGVLRRLSADWHSGEAKILGRQPNDPVIDLSCSADGRRLLSQGRDALYLWELPGGRLLHQLEFKSTGFAVLAADGRTIFCNYAGDVVERDAKSGDILRTVTTHDQIMGLSLRPDGCRLATLGHDRCLRMFEVPSGRLLWERAFPDGVDAARPAILSPALTFSPTAWLACAYSAEGRASTVVLFDADTGEQQGRYHGHADRVLGAAFTTDQRLYSWGADGVLLPWLLPASAPRTSPETTSLLSLRDR